MNGRLKDKEHWEIAMNIRVSYPSGIQFVVVGVFEGVAQVGGDAGAVPVIDVKRPFRFPGGAYINRGEALINDPRAVIQDADTGTVLYEPRNPFIYNFMDPNLKQWLTEHPEWPGVLEIDGLASTIPKPVVTHDELPGALPNGTLVEKIATDPEGDKHEDGAKAHILGSAAHPDGGLTYCVEWEDMPGLPVWIGEGRIKPVEVES